MRQQFHRDLERLAVFTYKSHSHSFNNAVIAAYNNVVRYGCTLTADFIHVPQQRRDLYFVHGSRGSEAVNAFATTRKSASFLSTNSAPPMLLYSEKECSFAATPMVEICYNLAELFTLPTPQINRGIKFTARSEVSITNNDGTHDDDIYNCWVEHKKSDPKVYQMAFNPARYRRVFVLKRYGYAIREFLITINNQPYGIMAFSIGNRIAYELAFLSKFYDEEMRIVNDQNICIMINCLHTLYEEGITTVNLGTAAGIKGLKIFKRQLPHSECVIFSGKANAT